MVTDGEKPLTGISQKNQKRKSFRLFFEIVTAPWRIQELYEGMRSAFACAKEKERVKVNHSEKGSKKEVWNMPLLGGTHPLKSPELYTCQKQQTRLEALSAAIAMGGVMGHFVGDLAQPFHTTVNFDGWLTGNGKIHEYFESSIVDELSPALESIVELRARSPHLQSLFIKKFQFDEKETTAAVRFSLVLASDSWNLLDEVIALDKKYAIVNASSKPMSHIESEHSSGKPKPSESKIPPQRLPASNKKILETFEPLIVERLAIASKALALLWYHAWISGGRPQLADVNSYEIPYALDVPFLWPSYDPEALNHSAKIEK
ncbi:MAG: hypothetical protein KDD35_04270 [Bdellovibrionales bacterium]|nr:hypothetical protein [Bdellovibrionales bacterium]